MTRRARRGGVGLGDVLREIVGQSSAGSHAALQARIDSVWDSVAGPEIAQHTRGFGLKKGTLEVHVDSHAWAAQLSFMSERLREALNERLEAPAVREIRFTVSRAVSDDRARAAQEEETARRYGGSKVEPSPLSEEEIGHIEAEAAGIKSDRLREAAIRARIRYLEWEKATRGRSDGEGGPGPP